MLSIVSLAETAAQAVAVCPELTALQKIAGLVTFGNTLLFAGTIGAVGFLVWLLYLIIPGIVYEALGYPTAATLIGGSYSISIDIPAEYAAFTGCMLFAGTLLVTSALHDLKENYVSYFSILTVIWGIAAVGYHSNLIGFFSVLALFGALGFYIRSYPFLTVIGFVDGGVQRASGTAFVILALFSGLKIVGLDLPTLSYFTYGGFLIGSFVLFLGLLIVAYGGYKGSRNYFARQLPIIVGGIAALFVGSVWDIPEMQNTAGTFFGLYLLEKVFDIPTKGKIVFAIKGLVISVIASGAGYFILLHKEFFAPYLFLL
ncbi:hypothetical protein L0Y46_00860 [bacterium]|nr:hypothetical protein [bacterium]